MLSFLLRNLIPILKKLLYPGIGERMLGELHHDTIGDCRHISADQGGIENMNRIPQTPAGKPWDLNLEQPEISYLGVTLEELAEVYSRVNSPMLGFSLNVAHAHLLANGFPPFLKAFGDKLGNVQISDNHGITDEHLPVGEGTVDFSSLVRQLKKMDYQGTLSLSVAKDRVLECKDRFGKILESVA